MLGIGRSTAVRGAAHEVNAHHAVVVVHGVEVLSIGEAGPREAVRPVESMRKAVDADRIHGTIDVEQRRAPWLLYTSNIPPHNLREVVDGCIHMIDHPDCTTEDLMQFIKGPDFPTGGIILGPVSYTHLDVYKRQGYS